MNEAALKAKVLFGLGLLATFFGVLFTPEIVRAVIPFVVCVFIASAVLFIPEMYSQASRNLSNGQSNKPQASPLKNTEQFKQAIRVISVPHIDYDNYLIPTYLRCQEVK